MSGSEALEAMLAHHRALVEGVTARAEAVATAAAGGAGGARAAVDLVAYLATEVLPHAEAEEGTIYRAARDRAALQATVEEMVAEHCTLAASVGRLAEAGRGPEAAAQAEQIATLFATHVRAENERLLPVLAGDEHVDLAQLLADLHQATEAARRAPRPAGPGTGGGPQATESLGTVVSLLLDATSGLARAGQGDQACRLTAAAWSALRLERPDLALRVTAAMHHLARLAAGQGGDRAGATPPADGGREGAGEAGSESPTELDVRVIPHIRRHDTIFATYEALGAGSAFVLVNDHDPRPLRYQFEATHPDTHTWDYLEAGPDVWRVRIGKR